MTVRLRELRRAVRHRYIRHLLWYLAAGLLTTIVMSWASTWIGAKNQTKTKEILKGQPPGDDRTFYVTRSFGSELAQLDFFIDGSDSLPWYLKWLQDEPPEPTAVDAPYWTVARLDESNLRGPFVEGAHGWPFKSLRWWATGRQIDQPPPLSWWSDEPDTDLVRWGIVVPRSVRWLNSFFFKHVLPLNPIWPGLLADTAIFASGWAMVVTSCTICVRWRRRRLGLCEVCGCAPAGRPGSNCPECNYPGQIIRKPRIQRIATRLGRLQRVAKHRYIRLPLQYLALGLVTTVAMAWACTWIGATNQTTVRGGYKDELPNTVPSFDVTRSFGSELAEAHSIMVFGSFWKLLFSIEQDWPKGVAPPYWTVARRADDRSLFIVTEGAHGWPFKSLIWWGVEGPDALMTLDFSEDRVDPETLSVQWGIVVPKNQAKLDSLGGKHILPLFPIWSGLLADTAIFAAGWAMVIAPTVILYGIHVRRRRRRRGQCEACGYSLANLPGPTCPECGKPLGQDERI